MGNQAVDRAHWSQACLTYKYPRFDSQHHKNKSKQRNTHTWVGGKNETGGMGTD